MNPVAARHDLPVDSPAGPDRVMLPRSGKACRINGDRTHRDVTAGFEGNELNGVDALGRVPRTTIREYNRYRRAPPPESIGAADSFREQTGNHHRRRWIRLTCFGTGPRIEQEPLHSLRIDP